MTKQLSEFQQPPLATCLDEVIGMIDKSDLILLPNPETGAITPAPLNHSKQDAYMQLRNCPNRDCPAFLVGMDRWYVGVNAVMVCSNREVAAESMDFLKTYADLVD